MLTPNRFSISCVITPIVPIVAMNANASGIPPKFAATPENVPNAERIHDGVPLRIAAYAIRRPNRPPPTAVQKLSLMLAQNASRRFAVRRMAITLLVV